MKKQPFGIGDVKLFFRELILRFAYFKSTLLQIQSGTETLQKYKSTPLNPGYPFTADNWSLPTREVAEARRTAMFEKTGYNSWGEYSSTVSSLDRKAFWDANSDLWIVGI